MSAYLRRYHERGQRCDRVNDSRVEDFPADSKWATLAAEWESAYHLEAAPRSKRKTGNGGNNAPPSGGTDG